jgi:hypothetical protein
MKYTNFDYNGGFPFDQSIMKRMQLAYFEHLTAYAKQLGCDDVGNYIIHGCQIVGADITPGMMYIAGEMCPFAGAVGTLATKIKKITTTTNAAFENGTNPPVFKETIAQVDATGTDLSEFTRFNFVDDANYVHTDNNFTALLLAKLNGIEDNAEENVQADWNVINPASDAFIKNKPIVENIVQSEHIVLGHFPNGGFGEVQRITIDIDDVGTNNYKVRAWIKSNSVVGSGGKDVICIATSNYQNDSFDVIGGEFSFAGVPEVSQNVTLFYEIILL